MQWAQGENLLKISGIIPGTLFQRMEDSRPVSWILSVPKTGVTAAA